MELDFDKDFQEFMIPGGGSAIKDIYDIIPSLSQEQMQVFNTLMYYTKKWELPDLREYLENYLMMMRGNKNLGMLSSFNMRNLLKAYTQDELIRGIKVNSNTGAGEK